MSLIEWIDEQLNGMVINVVRNLKDNNLRFNDKFINNNDT